MPDSAQLQELYAKLQEEDQRFTNIIHASMLVQGLTEKGMLLVKGDSTEPNEPRIFEVRRGDKDYFRYSHFPSEKNAGYISRTKHHNVVIIDPDPKNGAIRKIIVGDSIIEQILGVHPGEHS